MHTLVSLLVISTAAAPPAPIAAVDAEPAVNVLASFGALPPSYESFENPSTEARVELGRMLYFEKRLSKNHDVSCNSCHDLQRYGVDGKPFSQGHRKQLGGRNSPTVYNAGGHVAQFWDGRAATLEEQAKGPITNPVEMAAASPARVIETLASMPKYVTLFEKAFPQDKNPVTFDNVAKALGAFERKLVTPFRFDKYLGGDKTALDTSEKKGLVLFASTGCVACHNGPGLGGTMFQKIGLAEPWPHTDDPGRFSVTKAESDKMVFRVPTLRNVEKTGPYFHNGKVTSLAEAVKWMSRHQLGKQLTDEETQSIVAFLKSLTGELPTAYIKAPKLPPSTPVTPRPDPT